MFCMFPDSKSEWKKGATGQSFIRKEISSYRIGTLPISMYSVVAESVKVFFSKKVKKIDKIFTTYLTLTHCQIGSENFVNYYGLLGKQELYLEHHMTQ